MKRLLVVVAAVVALALGSSASFGRDQTCPGSRTASFGGLTDASFVGPTTALEALGLHLEAAHEIVREGDSSKGFETVTFRGYDADGELIGLVVVEGIGPRWSVARVDMCEA